MSTNFFIRLTLLAITFCLFGRAIGAEAGKIIFVAGDARLGATPAKVGDVVLEGATVTTGTDGYLYIQTIDAGFFILRAQSEALVLAYHTDLKNPANNRFKIELRQGVARSISGEAVKNSRESFRFNTPVAAIGVRGTDFTVFTDQQTTRVAVISGGVIASGFSASCTPEGGGPCEGASSRELYAGLNNVMQINRGQVMPQLLPGKALSPDIEKPPRRDEPRSSTTETSNNNTAPGSPSLAIDNTGPNLTPLKLANLGKISPTETTDTAIPRAAPAITWGRWQSVIDNPAEIDLSKLLPENQLIGANSHFALLRNKNSLWQPPTGGNVNFSLQDSQAVIKTDGSNALSIAHLENGLLSINFDKNTFITRFDLLSDGQRIQRQATGPVAANGTFANGSQFVANSNMLVQGVLANDPDLKSGYLFQSRIDDKRVASGVTYWTK